MKGCQRFAARVGILSTLLVCATSAAQTPNDAVDAGAADAGAVDAGIVATEAGTAEKIADAGLASPAKLRPLPPELRPRIEVELAPRTGLVTGDVVTLKLTVTGKPGIDVAVPEQSFAPFELLDRSARSEATSAGAKHVFELSFLALQPGAHTLPGVVLRVVGPKGELGDVRTEPETLTIASLLANEPNAEPRPATKPIVVMQDDYTLAWILGGLALAGLVAVATLLTSRWLKRRPKPVAPAPPPRPPWEVAVEKLLLLEREKESMFEAERGEEFIDQVGDTLREYLGRRYGFDGLESTTDEVLRTLERIRPNKLSLSGVSLLLEQCDLVKFARAAPEPAICDDLWNGAMGLIRATTPPTTPDELPTQLPGREL